MPGGRRLIIWIPAADVWLLAVVNRLRAEAKRRKGMLLSQGAVCRAILLRELRALGDGLPKRFAAAEPQRLVVRRCSVYFRPEDAGFVECLLRLVASKRDAGYSTSFSRELVRLARNGLTGEMLGAGDDRQILQEDA